MENYQFLKMEGAPSSRCENATERGPILWIRGFAAWVGCGYLVTSSKGQLYFGQLLSVSRVGRGRRAEVVCIAQQSASSIAR